MSTRAPAHVKQEKAIFDAFLVAYPSFAKQVKKIDQPHPFPDIVVELATGGLVDFELGEWLDGQQIAAAKRYDAAAEAMTAALGRQHGQRPDHVREDLPAERTRARARSLRDLSDLRAVQLIAVGSAPPTRVRALVEASASELQ